MRYHFSVGDVLLLLVLTEFPFPLTKEDKDSLAKVLADGNKTAKHWMADGPDIVFHSGEMKIWVQCKPFREAVDRNVATFRWGKERSYIEMAGNVRIAEAGMDCRFIISDFGVRWGTMT